MSIYQKTGARRKRIEVQAVTETRSGKGSVIKTWATSKKMWAEVIPVKGRETFAGRVLTGEISHIVRMPYTPLTPKNRLKLGDRILEIKSSENYDERNVKLEIDCTEKV